MKATQYIEAASNILINLSMDELKEFIRATEEQIGEISRDTADTRSACLGMDACIAKYRLEELKVRYATGS